MKLTEQQREQIRDTIGENLEKLVEAIDPGILTGSFGNEDAGRYISYSNCIDGTAGKIVKLIESWEAPND